MTSGPPTTERTRRLAIVEDHDRYRQLLREVIELMPGVDVVWEASAGWMALDMATRSHVDVAIVDLSLPDMNGAEVVEELCGRDPPVTCVVVTGHTEQSFFDRATRAGARAYVIKGRPADLREGITAALEGRRYRSSRTTG